MNKFITILAGGAILAATTLAAQAATLTFDRSSGAPFDPYTESGFNVTDNSTYIIADAGGMHLDISGGPYGATRTISAISGAVFSVTSLDIGSIWPSISVGGLLGAPRANISFTGFLGGASVAFAWGSSEIGNNTFNFDSAFSNIDSFLISGFDSGNNNYSQGIDVHLTIDNIVIAAVPLPASALLLTAALGGIGFVRRRRKA